MSVDSHRSIRTLFEIGRDGGRRIYGDRTGFVLFLGSLLFFTLSWRVGFFITDNYTLGNTLIALGDGHLYFTEIRYGDPSGAAPGTNIVGDRLYGRNYGQVMFALPFLWGLRFVALFADVAIAIIGGVSVLLLVFAHQLSLLADRQREGLFAGSAIALLFFWLNVSVAHEISARWVPMLALQLSTMVAAGFIGVMLYRLGSEIYDTRTGLFAGIVVTLASPVGFWATIPKRHSVVALLVVLAMYSLYRSRSVSTDSVDIRFNALAYVWVGLLAWVHAAIGLVLLVALGGADFVSHPRLRWRRVIAIGVAFGASLIPMFLTNLLISGNPFEPPRLLPGYGGEETVVIGDPSTEPPDGGRSTPADGTTPAGEPRSTVEDRPEGGGNRPGSGGEQPSKPLPTVVGGIFKEAIGTFTIFQAYIERGIAEVTDTKRLYRAYIDGAFVNDPVSGYPAARLAMLESMPLLGAVWLLLLSGLQRLSDGLDAVYDGDRGVLAADLFVVAFGSLLSLLYLPRIPLHAAITVRYLHPLYPLGAYLLIRIRPVRRVLANEWLRLWSVYAGTVLIGGQLLVVAFVILEPTQGRSIALTGRIALLLGGMLALWALLSAVAEAGPRGIGRERLDTAGAVAMGLTAGHTTVFVLLSAFEYFDVNQVYALPLVRVLAEAIQFLP